MASEAVVILLNGMHDKLFQVQDAVKLALQYQELHYNRCIIWYGGASLKKSLSETKYAMQHSAN